MFPHDEGLFRATVRSTVTASRGSHERPHPCVAYVRVSTPEQGRSGLGLDAQRATLERYVAVRGGRILTMLSEVMRGRGDRLNSRSELVHAIALARRAHATLVVAWLDRLGRSVPVVSALLAGDVAIEVADLPGASRVALQLAAVMAKYESRLTSERTRAGMQAARERGVSFTRTSCCFTAETRRKAAEGASAAHIRRALEAYADIAPKVVALHRAGRTWTQIARWLDAQGHTTSVGGRWSIASVQRLVRRQLGGAEREAAITLFEDVVGRRASAFSPMPAPAAEPLEHSIFTKPSAAPASTRPRPSKAIAYLRVSTRPQGADGFGIAAQRAIVAAFTERERLKPLAEYVDVASAWRVPIERRRQLLAALAHVQATGATLVIARLDRLARDASVVHALVADGTRFVCADAPWADQTTIALLAVLAEREAQLIADRMRDVRAVAKASGRPWGHAPNLPPGSQPEASRRSAELRRVCTRERYAYVEPIAVALRSEGLSLRRVADELNARGLETQRDTPWRDMSVRALLARATGG